MIRAALAAMLTLAAWVGIDPPPPTGDGRTVLAALIATATLTYYLTRSRTRGTN